MLRLTYALSQESVCQVSISCAFLSGASSSLMSGTYIWNRTSSSYSPPPLHTYIYTCIHTFTHKRHPGSTEGAFPRVWTVEAWYSDGCKFALQKCAPAFFSRGLWLADVFFNLRKVSAMFDLEFVCLWVAKHIYSVQTIILNCHHWEQEAFYEQPTSKGCKELKVSWFLFINTLGCKVFNS